MEFPLHDALEKRMHSVRVSTPGFIHPGSTEEADRAMFLDAFRTYLAMFHKRYPKADLGRLIASVDGIAHVLLCIDQACAYQPEEDHKM
jgi:hypothetical protein